MKDLPVGTNHIADVKLEIPFGILRSDETEKIAISRRYEMSAYIVQFSRKIGKLGTLNTE